MTTRRILVGSMLASLGCSEPNPQLFVLVEDAEAGCYRACEPVPERVADVFSVCPDTEFDACDENAKLGETRVALALDYGDTVRFDTVGSKFTRPTVAAVIDDNQTVALGDLENITAFEAPGRNDFAVAHDDFFLPVGPGGHFEFTVASGDLELRTLPVHFASPERPRLQILGDVPSDEDLAALDFDAPAEVVHLAHGEPCEACRSVWVAVSWPRFAGAETVTLTTSYGTLDDGTEEGTDSLELESTVVDGRAAVELRIPQLPEDLPVPEVVLHASVGSLRTSTSIPILTPPPTSASLIAPPTVTVDVAGSNPVVLAGVVTMPEGTALSTDSLSLIVDAVVDPNTMPVCAAALPDVFLRCDPDNVDPAVDGGCILTPSGISVLGETSFSITLAGGICFSGTVTIQLAALDVDATPIDDCATSACLAAAIGDTRVELLGAGVDIVFAPPAP